MLMYQLTRLTRDKGALLQDDRLDALCMACGYWVEQMAVNADLKINDRKAELLDEELERFKNAAFKINNKSARSTTWMATL
jgi:hypothetical protein